jgi:ferric-dicitrate binding protein FerR (iron transport regulator)
LAAGTCFLSLLLLAAGPASGFDGTLTYVSGPASVTRNGRAVPITAGMPILSGDVLRTGAGATVIVTVSGSVDIKLRENTTLDVSQIEDGIRVNLAAGSVFSRIFGKILGRYQVETQTVLAGVRGTEFFMAYGRKVEALPDVWLCVNSGSVDLTVPGTGESTRVRGGEGVNVLGGTRLTVPRRYRWTEELNWNMNPASGPVEDETELDRAYSDLLDQDYL